MQLQYHYKNLLNEIKKIYFNNFYNLKINHKIISGDLNYIEDALKNIEYMTNQNTKEFIYLCTDYVNKGNSVLSNSMKHTIKDISIKQNIIIANLKLKRKIKY